MEFQGVSLSVSDSFDFTSVMRERSLQFKTKRRRRIWRLSVLLLQEVGGVKKLRGVSGARYTSAHVQA